MTAVRVTLVVPMRNEEANIEACLTSVVNQDYGVDHLEVLVYDGASTDASWSIVEGLALRHPSITLHHNPRRTQAAAWNQGIERASGEIIGIVGAHSVLAPDYVTTAVATLNRTGADMVGGPMSAKSDGVVGQAVAVATSTPFGVGGARFHYTDREEDVDTVYMGLCRAEVYRSLGFDEEMVRNQDDELSYRLLDRGGRIVCDPRIRSTYHNRATWRGLARQYFEYGFWKVQVMRKHPRQVRARHLAPVALVVTLGASAVLAVTTSQGLILLAVAVGGYVLADLSASLAATRRHLTLLPAVSAVYPVLHLSYGSGFIVGLARELLARIRPLIRGDRPTGPPSLP